jgi:hypothetical protein
MVIVGEGKARTDAEWLEYAAKLLRETTFYTKEAQEEFTSGIESNMLKVQKQKKDLEKRTDVALQQEMNIDETKLKELKKKLSKIEGRPERGVETLFRLTSKNHFTLNSQVDSKSSNLISINSIILSIVVGVILPQIGADPHLLVPVIMLLITNTTSIVFAIFATRPDKAHGTDGKIRKSNLLFYGNFHHLSEEEYLEGMRDMLNNSDDLYDSITKDIYYLGLNLKRKFGFLRKSFTIFMYGLISSVLVFVICHVFFGDFTM